VILHMTDWYLTPAEVAKRANRTPATVREWANRGQLPCTRTETGVRIFREADVERFLGERAKRPIAPDR
jgi:excisionase family DNA binding protein